MAWSKHKKILTLTKGFRGRANSCYRTAINRLEKGMLYAYRDRKVKKREMKSQWIQRINAGVRLEGFSYSKFMHSYNQSGMEMDRKVLAELAATEPSSFRSIVEIVKSLPPRLG
jgi:large subunit ribosomal protein L20